MAESTEVRTVDGRYYEVIQKGQSDLLFTNIRYAGIEIFGSRLGYGKSK